MNPTGSLHSAPKCCVSLAAVGVGVEIIVGMEMVGVRVRGFMVGGRGERVRAELWVWIGVWESVDSERGFGEDEDC